MKQFSKNIPKSSYLGKSFWVINSINSVIFSKYPDNCVNKGKDRGFKREISNYIKYSRKDTVSVEFIFKLLQTPFHSFLFVVIIYYFLL